jgi:hypothetical protein
MKPLINVSEKFKNEKGIVIVYVAILLVVFLGMAAFAIDIGYHSVVRNQLQNAADAAALVGCNHLYVRNPTLGVFNLDWQEATDYATDAVTSLNAADNKSLIGSDADVGHCWWDPTLRRCVNSPSATTGPAVIVKIDKTAGKNNGPITNYFGGILGVQTNDSSATATAVAYSPRTARSGALLPFAITTATANRPLGTSLQICSIFSANGSNGCPYLGRWTSFGLGSQADSVIDGMITTGNPANLTIGDNIFIASGVMDNLYRDIIIGTDYVLPVVSTFVLNHNNPIAGFVRFRVTASVSNGNRSYIRGFIVTPPVYGGGSVDPNNYGPIDTCRLCQ